ncbi:hypothetical protein RAG47_25000, partial [Klebsiella pneumoniae]
KRAYCLKTQPATGETYPKSDLFNKANAIPQYTEENTREETPDKTRPEQSPAPYRLPTLTSKDNANS